MFLECSYDVICFFRCFSLQVLGYFDFNLTPDKKENMLQEASRCMFRGDVSIGWRSSMGLHE